MVNLDLERARSLFRRMEQLLSRTRSRPAPEHVHQVRTTARRLEALLKALHPDSDRGARKLMRRLGRLRRRAGGVRDIDVQIIALRKLRIGREEQRKTRLLQALADQRAGQEKKLLARLSQSRIRKLRKLLRGSSEGVLSRLARAKARPKAPGSPKELALRTFASLVRRYRVLTPTNIHEYRKQGKRVRYIAEMAGEDAQAAHIVKVLKRQQDSVGDWHDWFTLTETAQSLFANASGSALLAALQNVTNAKFMEARRVCLDVRRELLSRHRALLKAQREALRQERSAARKAARTRARRRPNKPPRRAAVAAVGAATSGAA